MIRFPDDPFLTDFLSPYTDDDGKIVDVAGALEALDKYCQSPDFIDPGLKSRLEMAMSALRGL